MDDVPRTSSRAVPEQAQALAGRGAVELWSGDFDAAVASFEAGVAPAGPPRTATGRADCLGHLALLEALRGRLGRAAELAAEAAARPEDDTDRQVSVCGAAAEVALACVHLERNELPPARRWHKRAEDALRARPDKLIGVGGLHGRRLGLAEGRGRAVSEIVNRAREGWSPPSWIEHRLLVLDSWALRRGGPPVGHRHRQAR